MNRINKRYFVTAEEMKQYDRNTISYFGIPSMVLMERAAVAAAEEIQERSVPEQRVLIVAGCGNNGGDGIAVGRILHQRGYLVDICLVGERSNCSEETEKQLQIIEKYGCPVQNKIGDGEYDIIVDALFGIGLSRNPEGIYAQAIEAVNAKNTYVCALDIPSGINANTGEVMGIAIKAKLTVTFAFEKLGHILYPGCQYAGEVVCRDIGITKESFLDCIPKVSSYQMPVHALMPKRAQEGNKGTFGKILMIAGSVNMSGACELCARSSYRIGAGMVKIVTPEENRVIVQQNIPEALLSTYRTKLSKEQFVQEMQDEMRQNFAWADCIVIGPGMGMSEEAKQLLEWVITGTDKPLVIDADAINLLSESEELRTYLEKNQTEKRTIIMTPHIGEFARLYGCAIQEVKNKFLDMTKELANRYHCVMVCKDARTAVAAWKEEGIYLNALGNDGMATAGMGDVLTGIIGGLLAQEMPAKEAACAGVYIHAAAGDRVAQSMGKHAVMAGDVIESLGKLTLFVGRAR